MVKVAPNSNFFGRFSEINLHSKIKRPLLIRNTNEEPTTFVNTFFLNNLFIRRLLTTSLKGL